MGFSTCKSWETDKVKNLIKSKRNGIYKKKEFHGRGVKIVNMGELFEYDFISDQKMELIELNRKEKSKFLLEDGDLLFARRSLVLEGSGKCSLVINPKGDITFESSIIRLRPDKEIADPKFYFYYFSSPKGRSKIMTIASQTAVSGIRSSDLIELEVDVPPLNEQKQIASKLTAFDSLIKNNNRRIEILEEMAQRIYREWFVHFRYPGHENDELVDSCTDLGEIPEGWEVKPIDDVIDAMGGGTPRTKVDEYWDGGNITWFTPSDLTSSGQLYISDSGRKITDEGLDNSSAKMFPPYSVMMTSRATLGVIAFNTVPASVNQGFIVCIPNEKVSAYQIYFWLKEKLPSMINQASGATYKEIRKTDFRKMNFPVIEENVHDKFVEKVEPIFKEIENLERKNEKLKETRDLLLPKLISGKIDAKERIIED